MADPSTYRPQPGTIPDAAGVYRFRDEHRRVIYVEWTVVSTEVEALQLAVTLHEEYPPASLPRSETSRGPECWLRGPVGRGSVIDNAP